MIARTTFLVIAAILLIVFLVWATRISGRPESTAGHHDPGDEIEGTASEGVHGDHAGDRPAGADAEDTVTPDSGIRWRSDPPAADAVGGSPPERPAPVEEPGSDGTPRSDGESW